MTDTLTQFADFSGRVGEVGSSVAIPIATIEGEAYLEAYKVVGIRTVTPYGSSYPETIVLDLQNSNGAKATVDADNSSLTS
jgi:hypothetical protein